MNKFLTILLVFTVFSSIAQVDKIKSSSSSNKGGLFSEGGSHRSSSGSDACANACGSCCMDVFITNLVPFVFDTQKEFISKRSEIKRMVSLDLQPQFGYNSRSSFSLLPRVRGNWGIFSTDIRYTSLLDEDDFWNTFDWQIIQINWVVIREFNLRTGLGFMYEVANKQSFPEYTINLDFYILNGQYNPSLEFRFTDDYITNAIPRMEASAVLNYKIMESQSLTTHLSFGVNFQDYYENHPQKIASVKYWGFVFGMLFNFH